MTFNSMNPAMGWNEHWADLFSVYEDTCRPARITRVDRGECTVRIIDSPNEYRVQTHHDVTVGDWVAITDPDANGSSQLVGILPRKSSIVRSEAGGAAVGQALAANVDIAFIVSSLEVDVNLRRIERFLALSWQSAITPVIVLNKVDLVESGEEAVANVAEATLGVDVIAVSGEHNLGMEQLIAYLKPGDTAVLLGQSGVGKSTIVNYLAAQSLLAVQQTRGDGKGRHTTTHRELIELDNGAFLIDTPGIRELRLWNAEEGISRTFRDIEELTSICRFNDCKHETEPGCAVAAALESGTIKAGRIQSYNKLVRESQRIANRQDKRAQSEQRKKHRAMSKQQRVNMKPRRS